MQCLLEKWQSRKPEIREVASRISGTIRIQCIQYMANRQTKIAIPLQRETIVLIVTLEVKRIAGQLRKPLFSGAP